jgi:DNA-binding XRE family transcriptional regulator
MTGAELQALRHAAGINQTDMGAMIDATRHSVSYWETKGLLPRHAVRWGIPAKMLEAMGHPLSDYRTPTRTRGDGVLAWHGLEQAAIDRHNARVAKRIAHQNATRRVICAARTRKGQPCRLKSEPGRTRCKFHGGKSTGPRTYEGKARIAAVQRARWATYRQQQGATT